MRDEINLGLGRSEPNPLTPHRQVPMMTVYQSRQSENSANSANNDLVKNDLWVAEEIPVALVYNGISHVVLMATPQDVADLAVGFSISEGIIANKDEIMRIDVAATPLGITVDIEIIARRLHDLQQRRRNLVGATGCGLCGVESLAQLDMGIQNIYENAPGGNAESELTAAINAKNIFLAFAALGEQQILNRRSHSLHAAAFANRQGKIKLLREDVGRHNALDKLIGAMAQENISAATDGFIIMSSRCSYELVRKAARMGVKLLATISAPTGRAIDEANKADMGLIALARTDSMKIFCQPERVAL